MPKSWKEVLEDSKAFPNDLSVPVAEGVSLTMGELRAIEVERRKQLDEQAGVLDRAANAIAKLYEDAEKARASAPTPTPTPTPTPSADLENDPLFAPVFKQMKSIDERVTQTLGKFDKLPSTIESLVKIYEQDRMNNTFQSLPDRPADLTVEQLAQYAIDNGIKDKVNRLDLRRAYDAYRAPELARQREEAKFNEGVETGKKTAAIESAPKPRFIKPTNDGTKPSYGSVREAMGAMRADPKIMADLNESIAALGRQ